MCPLAPAQAISTDSSADGSALAPTTLTAITITSLTRNEPGDAAAIAAPIAMPGAPTAPANETLTTNDDDGASEAGSSELSELELPASWDDKALKTRILRGATLATLETELVDIWCKLQTREHSKARSQADDRDFFVMQASLQARSFRQRSRAAMQAAVSGP